MKRSQEQPIVFEWTFELVRDSYRNLVRHRVRSLLTLLGVIFGVASVITMLAIGEGAQQTVLREISGLGLNNIIVDSVKPADAVIDADESVHVLRFGVTDRDVAQLRAVLPDAVLHLVQYVDEKVHWRGRRLDVKTRGVDRDYFTCFACRLLEGHGLADAHGKHAMNVAVLNREAAAQLARPGGALGARLKVGRITFRVIGVLDIATRESGGLVLIPHGAAERRYGRMVVKQEAGRYEFTRNEVGRLIVHTVREDDVPQVAAVVQRTLQANHKVQDYAMIVPLDILRSKQRTQRIFNLVLIAIASISLLVGGIGIMNIMLAIVMERIREIGIRRAVGAGRRDIFIQFLAETLTLSSAGGLIGFLLGMAMVPLAGRWTGWPGVIPGYAIFLSLAVSWLVGVVFGTAPALRAARLDPVVALRYE